MGHTKMYTNKGFHKNMHVHRNTKSEHKHRSISNGIMQCLLR
jgi:hypothetical protein